MAELLTHFTSKYLFIVAGLLPIMNPPSMVPIFYSFTRQNSTADRAYLARRIAIYCFVLLLASMYIGSFVLEIFGVSLPVVQVGGGLLLTFAAWRMLNDSPAESNPQSAEEAVEAVAVGRDLLKQRAFFPLTFPLTVGPGSISVAITIGASLSSTEKGLMRLAVAPVASLAAVASLSCIVYLCYRHSDKVLRYLGSTGTVVFLRLTAFILLCMGIQIMWNGASSLVGELLRDNAAILGKLH